MYVIESLESQVDPTENIHGLLGGARGMPIPTFNVTMSLCGLQPDAQVQVENRKVVQGHLAIPSSENVHVVLIYHCRMPKTNLGLRQELKTRWDLSLLDHGIVFRRVRLHFDTLNVAPAIGPNLVAVHV